nr:protein TBATA isoform X16 [Odocoileus virginianus texanus]
MATEVRAQLAEHSLPSPRSPRRKLRMEQETQGPGQRNSQRAPRQNALLSTSRVHLHTSREPPFSQGRQKGKQTASSPKAEPKLEKKSGCQPRSHGDSGPQKELTIPGTVDFKLIREAVRTSKPQTPSAYRFGRLSHHSFFSRHHPQPQHVTHIQDLTGKPVCVVRDKLALATSPQATLLPGYLIRMPTISVPVGDPQSNRDPRLYSEAWKKELKDLASQVAIFTKESELKSKESLATFFPSRRRSLSGNRGQSTQQRLAGSSLLLPGPWPAATPTRAETSLQAEMEETRPSSYRIRSCCISARCPPQIPHLSRKWVKNLPPGLLAEKAFYKV